jgi:hypothetical protein
MIRQRDFRKLWVSLLALFIIVAGEVKCEEPALDKPDGVIEVMGLACSGVEYYEDGSIEDIALKREWQRYHIPLKNIDLSSIKTGFVVTITGQQTPVTVYLDSIRFVR